MEAQHGGHEARPTSSLPRPAPSSRWVMSLFIMRPNPFLLHMTHRGVVPLMDVFTCSLRCMPEHWNPLPKNITEHAAPLSSAHWLAGLYSRKVNFSNSWLKTPAVTPPSLDPVSKRSDGSHGSWFPFKWKIFTFEAPSLAGESDILRKQISPQGTIDADCFSAP